MRQPGDQIRSINHPVTFSSPADLAGPVLPGVAYNILNIGVSGFVEGARDSLTLVADNEAGAWVTDDTEVDGSRLTAVRLLDVSSEPVVAVLPLGDLMRVNFVAVTARRDP